MSVLFSLFGTFANMAGIILGCVIGLFIGKKLPQRMSQIMNYALGLSVLYVGIDGALKGNNTLVAIVSLVLGAIIGELLDLDKQVNRLGAKVQDWCRALRPGSTVSVMEGFVNATILFCVGGMVIVGPLQSGIVGDHSTLLAKSCLDMVSAVIMTATMGVGVSLSAFPILIVEGGLTLLARWVAPFLSDAVVAEITCAGSIIILGIGLNILGITKLKLMNFAPAIILPVFLCPAYDWIVGLLSSLVR